MGLSGKFDADLFPIMKYQWFGHSIRGLMQPIETLSRYSPNNVVNDLVTEMILLNAAIIALFFLSKNT